MDIIRALVNDDIIKVEEGLNNLFKADNIIFKDIEKFLQSSSKRIRSILCLLYLKANNAIINEKIIELLISAEIIHNASLLHDDVIDEAEQRRGNLSFYRKYNSKISVLSGDYLLSYSVKNLLKINNEQILSIFLEATENMCKSEIEQYINRNREIDVDEYLNTIYGKTACLFMAILKSAALIVNLDDNQACLFGKLYGILFQINNDEQKDSVVNDKKNGIKTAVDILGIEKTQSLKDNYKEEMSKIIKSLPQNEYSRGLEDLIKLL